MLNNLIDKLSGNDLTLNQLAEHLDLTWHQVTQQEKKMSAEKH